MNEDEVILKGIKYGILGVLGVLTLLFGSCQATKYQIVQAIEAGASPLEAECALTDSGVGCLLISASTAEKIR